MWLSKVFRQRKDVLGVIQIEPKYRINPDRGNMALMGRAKGSVQLSMIQPLPINIYSRLEFAIATLQPLDKGSRSHIESLRDPILKSKKTFSEMAGHRNFFEGE